MSSVDIDALPFTEVLVKFFTHRPSESRIPFRRRNDAAIEAQHARKADKLGIDANRFGRGKGDSGQLIAKVEMASVAGLLEDLRLNGFKLVNALWQETRKGGRPGKTSIFVCFTYALKGEPLELSPFDAMWLHRRSSRCYQTAYLYKNPQAETEDGPFTFRRDTVNLLGSQGDDVASRVIIRMPRLGEYTDFNGQPLNPPDIS